MIEQYIHDRQKNKPLLLMLHLVLGYPSLQDNMEILRIASRNNIDFIEMQIPFSDPSADGHHIIYANQEALKNNITVDKCLEFLSRATLEFPQLCFIFMTYFNILLQKQLQIIKQSSLLGCKGWIVPDLPPEESKEYTDICRKNNVSSIFIFTPTSSPKRLKFIATYSTGMVYCMSRQGVTGQKTQFNHETELLIKNYRQATSLPLAMGFGVAKKSDLQFLSSKVNVAVIGSKLIEIQKKEGIKAAQNFIENIV